MATEFLYLLADEVRNNKRLANRIASGLKKAEAEIISETAPDKKKPYSLKKYGYPEGFDAFKIYYDKGTPGLYQSMTGFSLNELKGVLVNFTNLPRESYVKKRNARLLLDMAVEGVKRMAGRSQAFGDYKMPE